MDLSHTFKGGLVLDALYTGVPGVNELYLGVGHQWKPTAGVIVSPMAYAVFGKENDEAGVTLGALLAIDRAASGASASSATSSASTATSRTTTSPMRWT